MRFLFTGNFIPPYEEENLHNETIVGKLQSEGHVCRKINIQNDKGSGFSNKYSDTVFTINYPDFILKFFYEAVHTDLIHFLTKGYTRPGLMKLMTAVFIGKLLRKRVFITIHTEMFSVMGQLRSKAGGQQLLHASFSLAEKIICGDGYTREVASMHYDESGKYLTIPAFFAVPDKDDQMYDLFRPLNGCDKVLMLAGSGTSPFLRDITTQLMKILPEKKIGFILAGSAETIISACQNNASAAANVAVPYDDPKAMSAAMSRADMLIRPLSCDSRHLFGDIAVSVKRPRRASGYIYYPDSLLLIKEGRVEKDSAIAIKNFLEETPEDRKPADEDPWSELRGLY